jgi:tRNA threonylcarbamoyladenosine modification (KEOPS) complex Cgi121 subunit
MRVRAFRCKKTLDREMLNSYTEIQAIDASFLYGLEHAEFAIQKARKALECGENISSNLFVEIITRASGQRQIKRAMEMYGLQGSREVVIIGEEIPLEFLDHLGAKEFEIKIDEKKLEMLKKGFSIDEGELEAFAGSPEEAIKDLIKERIALVSLL